MSDEQIVAFLKISEVGEDVQNCIKELQDMPLSKEDDVTDCIVKLPSSSFADNTLLESYVESLC